MLLLASEDIKQDVCLYETGDFDQQRRGAGDGSSTGRAHHGSHTGVSDGIIRPTQISYRR